MTYPHSHFRVNVRWLHSERSHINLPLSSLGGSAGLLYVLLRPTGTSGTLSSSDMTVVFDDSDSDGRLPLTLDSLLKLRLCS